MNVQKKKELFWKLLYKNNFFKVMKLRHFFYVFFFISSIFFVQEAQGQQSICEWTIPTDSDITIGDVSYNDGQKVFTDIHGEEPNLSLDCIFDQPVSLKDKLIGFEFEILSPSRYDLQLLLVNSNGDEIYSSKKIKNIYDIYPKTKRANLVLDPNDFRKLDVPELTDSKEDFNSIQNLKLKLDRNDFDSISLTNPDIITIEEFPDFALDENLPIQSTIPAFLGLILISFPLGFVLLNKANFLKEENFFVKIPWFVGFGFCVYLAFIYLTSLIWISAEVVVGYLIFEISLLIVYLKKNKPSLMCFQKPKSKNTIIFFSIIVVISGTLAVNYVDSIGWPTGVWDSRFHVSIISLTMAKNTLHDGQSHLPVSDIPGLTGFTKLPYPKGAHAAAAGVSFLTGSFPAVSMESTFGFVVFLIPLMLASIVYKFTKSIFLSSIMFVVTFWEPMRIPGDIILSRILTSNFAGHVGIIILMTSLMLFIAYFEKGNKSKLFIYFALSVFVLAITYSGFFVLPILIGIIGFLIYHIKDNKKRAIVFAILIAVFLSMPLWTFTAHELLGLKQGTPYIPSRWNATYPFNPNQEIFPLWISSVFGVICASLLIINKRYRAFSIVVLLVSYVHLLPLSHDLALYYGFFYKSLRSIGLMFLISVSMNLIMFYFIAKQISLNPSRIFSKFVKSKFSMIAVLGVLIMVLFPGFQILEDRTEVLDNKAYYRKTGSYIDTFPGGNERNLQLWLYENAKPTDLILNDHSHAAKWFIGVRAQEMINGHRQDEVISRYFKYEDENFQAKSPGVLKTIRGNEILKHPWDQAKIEQIIKELGIKYIYLSERERFEFLCLGWAKFNECYPNSEKWAWRNYSGNSRIAMYENHPNLELILRNGNSAIFKVIGV